MAEYMIQGDTLTAIANAIRAKAESTGSLTPAQMAAAIAEIGGLPGKISALDYGTVTYNNSTTTYFQKTHGMGVVPNFCLICVCDSSLLEYTSSSAKPLYMQLAYISQTSECRKVTLAKSSASSFQATQTDSAATNYSATQLDFQTHSSSVVLQKSAKYFWICGVVDDIV